MNEIDTQQSHTSTPWGYFQHIPLLTWHIGSDPTNYKKGDPTIANMGAFGDQKANAAFIVRACNSHDDLVVAAELLLQQYDSSGDFTMGGNLTNEPFLMFRVAIAKAKQNE